MKQIDNFVRQQIDAEKSAYLINILFHAYYMQEEIEATKTVLEETRAKINALQC